MKIKTLIGAMMIFSLACFAANAEENKQVATKPEDEAMRNAETAKILARIGENTKKYPKIGVHLNGVRWADVGKCVKQIKEDSLGDIVVFAAIGYGKPEKPTVEEKGRYYKSWVAACKQNGLFFYDYCQITNIIIPREIVKIAPEYYVGSLFGEYGNSGGFHWFPKHDGQIANMKEARAEYMGDLAKKMSKFRQACGPALILENEGGPIGHGEGLEAGTDIMSSEHYGNIGFSLSSARGASKAYGRPLWGAWLNVEFYAGGGYGPPRDDSYTEAHQRRLMLDYNMSYIHGADLIVLQDCLFDITIGHTHSSTNKPAYDMNSPQCRGFREKAKEFHKYVQSHPRSGQAPAVDLGLVWGNLEGAPTQKQLLNINSYTKIWWQSGWRATIEQGWKNLLNADLFAKSRYSGTPYGQVDIVPVQAPIDVLQKYKTLMFLGWNTMTPEIYAKLKEYVKNGGNLFMSLPQLSRQIERKPELELINNGDFRDLFGVTVKGRAGGSLDGAHQKAKIRFDRESVWRPA